MNARSRAGLYPVKTLFVDPDRAGVEALVRSSPEIITPLAIVPSVAEALGALQADMPQLLVTELELVDASGIELVRRVRQMTPARRPLVMVTTSRSAVAEKVAAFRAGADDFLVKPVDPAIFALRVRQLMIFFLLDVH